ncbi:MAG: acetoin utilization protein AcuC [Candidatus Dormibacteraeota bacterium]|nr:acetoin utilization protein AcuC [Candidatus Dormibacteraeota bacterium]
MSGDVRLVWGEAFMAYRLSEEHPLQPIRVKLAVELIRELGLVEFAELVPPRTATDQELALCHSPRYVELVAALSDPARRSVVSWEDRAEAGFASADNPVADGMHEACATIVGGSLMAAEAVHTGAALHSFNPAGGLHHAMRDRASGFCVYNDIAIAVAWLRSQGHRVACVDVDVHHGDGTQALFYSDPEVLTISLHESGRYLFPGTGFPDEVGAGAARGTSANLPLQPYSWDEPLLAAFEAVVPPLLREFRPTILVTQDGCDTHFLDPLAHIQGSTAIWPHIGRRFHELAHELCEGRWVATGGGGYAIREVVPRAWSLLFAEMVERPDLARGLIDPEPFTPGPEAQARVWAFLDRDLQQLSQELEVPLHLDRPDS